MSLFLLNICKHLPHFYTKTVEDPTYKVGICHGFAVFFVLDVCRNALMDRLTIRP